MKRIIQLILLLLVLPEPVIHAAEPEPGTSPGRLLRGNFDRWLAEPDTYRRRALEECGAFPEGRIYPFVIPALAYANLVETGDAGPEEAAAQMRKLIDPAILLTADFVKAPDGDLMKLESYRHQGTFLAALNLALSRYAKICPDGRYTELNNHISHLLVHALLERTGAALDSYPEYTWYLDTLMALCSLHLWAGETMQPQVDALYRTHMQWRADNILLKSGLPRAYSGGPSRGSDLSMQIGLLDLLDHEAAVELYGSFVKHHWIDAGLFGGFSEWPAGYPAPPGGDLDSGPVILGIGGTASGLGIGAAAAAGDADRRARLVTELRTAALLIHGAMAIDSKTGFLEWMNAYAPLKPECYSGFLYGDCSLFLAVTWPDRTGHE